MRATDFPCYPYRLRRATSRSMRLPEKGIDKTVILHHIQLASDGGWLEQSVKFLANKSKAKRASARKK